MNYRRGATLLMAMLVAAVMLSASVAVANIALQEITFSVSERDSNKAFFAADLGLECGIYWDLTKNVFLDNNNNFVDIQCGGTEITTRNGQGGVEVGFDINGEGYCSKVLIKKTGPESTVESRGYSSGCNEFTDRTVERALRSTYR